jgi:diacylglycerol kinase
MNNLDHRQKSSIVYQLKAFKFALNGLYCFFKLETKAFIHLLFAALALGMGFLLKLNTLEWIFICIAIGLVFITEMFNTAIERIVDHVSPERSEMARISKDLSAAAVFVASVVALAIGLIIFLPKLLILIALKS